MTKRLTCTVAAVTTAMLFGTAHAQSSGNFTARIAEGKCVQSDSDGTIAGGTKRQVLETTIHTPGSSQTTLLITPSLLSGIYTESYINTQMPQATESVAIKMNVTLDGNPVTPAGPVTYDSRFQQIDTQLYQQLSECRQENNPNCDFHLVESTLSTHSFNFVATDVGVGDHTLRAEWTLECKANGADTNCADTATKNDAIACVGPGSFTITQTKAFSQSGGVVDLGE